MGILKMKSPPNCHFIFRLNQQMPTCNGMMTMTMFIVVPTSLRMVCSWGRAEQGSSSSYFRLEFAFVARNCCRRCAAPRCIPASCRRRRSTTSMIFGTCRHSELLLAIFLCYAYAMSSWPSLWPYKKEQMVPENKMKKGCPKRKNSAVLALLRPGGKY